MRVLIACEESQRVCIAFREKGHEAYSCDLIDESGGHPEWHIKDNCIRIIDGDCSFLTCDGVLHHFIWQWDLIIAHPPCTYLASSGAQWFNVEKHGEKAIKRKEQQHEAIAFFIRIANAKCKRIAIENPVGVMSTAYRKPDQIVDPWWFGDPYEKKTCLWLKGLPKLQKTNAVTPEPRIRYESGRSIPQWASDTWKLKPDERRKARSKTFPGFAKAMAEQWGGENYAE